MVGAGVWSGISLALNQKSRREKSAEVFSPKVEEKKSENLSKEIEEEVDILGVLREVDHENKKIVLYNLKNLKEEGYIYDDATHVRNRFDRELVMKGLPLGSVVELYFKSGGGLDKVLEHKKSWEYKNVSNLTLKEETSTMRIGESTFVYDAGLTVVNGKEIGRVSDLLPSKDILEVRGMADKVVSIVVTKGHGTLDFVNFDEFLGGSIEVGYEVFDEIRENMKYVLREGTYKVVMANGGLLVNKVVEIQRDRIRLLDVGKLSKGMDKKSLVKFQISPGGAILLIDGREVDYRSAVKLPYGEYILKAMKEGYVSWEDVLNIGKPTEKIGIRLALLEEEAKEERVEEEKSEKEEGMEGPEEGYEREEEREEVENTEDREREIRVRRDEGKKISFLKPEGATILLDDKVVGIVPCETVKITGEHKITVAKDGYNSVSYTVDIEDDGEDAVFSFPELTE